MAARTETTPSAVALQQVTQQSDVGSKLRDRRCQRAINRRLFKIWSINPPARGVPSIITSPAQAKCPSVSHTTQQA